MDEDTLPLRFRRLSASEAEWGNPGFSQARPRILIVRLSSYADVDKSTSHLFLFACARKHLPEAFIDFAFLPGQADRARLSKADQTLLYGWASGKTAASFDLILISNSFGLELLNLVPLLSSSGIPTSAVDRTRAFSPILILGGSNAFAAQAVYADPLDGMGDALVDAVFFGEGEKELPAMLKAFAANLKQKGREALGETGRRDLLLSMKDAAPGLSLPGLKPEAVQSVLPLIEDDSAECECEVPLLGGTEANTARLSISRGCPYFCSFCMEGWERKPWREVSSQDLARRAVRMRAATGAENLEIASYNFNAHSDIVSLLTDLSDIFPRVSLMSQRVDILARTPGLLDFERAIGKRSFTLGVEGISQRLRNFFRKELGEEDIRTVLEALFKVKAREIKLFYIISGHENAQDVDSFSGFLSFLAELKERLFRGARILISTGFLVRMPGTPLAWSPLKLDMDELLSISRKLEAACAARGYEYRLASSPDEYLLSQVLASGGKELHGLLLHLAKAGFWYEGSLAKTCWDVARRVIWPEGKAPSAFMEEKTIDHVFPLAFVQRNIDPKWVHDQWLACSDALRGESEPGKSCLGGRCASCGACPPSGGERTAILSHSVRAPSRAEIERIASTQLTRARAQIAYAIAEVPERLARASRESIASWLCRRIIAADAGQASNLLSVSEALFSDTFGLKAFTLLSGRVLFRLSVLRMDSLLLAARSAGLECLNSQASTPMEELYSGAEIEIRIHPAELKGLENAFSRLLAELPLPATMTRSDGRTNWSPSAKGLKRKFIKAAELRVPPCEASESPEALLRVQALARFDPSPFLQEIEKRGEKTRISLRFLSLSFRSP